MILSQCRKQFGVLFLFLGLLVVLIQPISAAEEVTLKMNRNFGSDLGNGKIQGDFTIKCSGIANIVFLQLYFNQTKVANATSNSLSFRFNTDDYALGKWNISLDGFTALDERFSTFIMVEFISEEISTYIAIGVGGLVLIVLTFRIIRAIKYKKAKKEKPEDIKKAIKIQIDKDFT